MRRIWRDANLRCTALVLCWQCLFMFCQYFVGKGHAYGWVENLLRIALVITIVMQVPVQRLFAKERWVATVLLAALAAVCTVRYNMIRYAPARTIAYGILFLRDVAVYGLVIRGLWGLTDVCAKQRCAVPIADARHVLARYAPFIGVFVVTLAGLCAQWMLNLPFRSTDDFRNQLGQIRSFHYTDIHALGHTIFLKILLSVWWHGAFVVLVQVLLVALLNGLFAQHVCRKGASYKVYILLTAGMFCLLPATFFFYPWKDAPYTFVVGVATYYILRSLDKDFRLSWLHALAVGSSLGWMILFRQNGIVPALGCLGYFLWYARRSKAMGRFAALAVAMVLWIGGVNWYGYGPLQAASPPNGYELQVFGSGIAAVVANDGNITPEQAARMAEILPVDFMRETYTPWEGQKLIWDTDYFKANDFRLYLAEHRAEVIGLYFELLPGNLLICLKDFVYNSFEVWSVYYLYSNGTLMLLLLALAMGAWGGAQWKRRWVLLMPIAASAASIAISTITNEMRYLLPTYTLFVPLAMAILYGREPDAKEPEQAV